MNRGALSVCVLLAIGTMQAAAHAEPTTMAPPAPVVVVQSREHAEFGRRLRGYLQGSAWLLEENQGNPPTGYTSGGQLARAVVWLELRPGTSVFEVHLRDVRTAQEVVREVPFQGQAGGVGESAALEAAALIAGAVLEDWYAAGRELTSISESTSEPLDVRPTSAPPRSTDPVDSPAKSLGKLAVAVPSPRSERGRLGISAGYFAFFDDSVVRHGPAVEAARLSSWYLGVHLSWSQGTWRSRDAASAAMADVRVHTGAVGAMGGPRLALGADFWLLPAVGAELAYLARRTAWVVDGLMATDDATFLSLAARARVTLDTASWCLTSALPCPVRGRFTLAALGTLFTRRPVWAIQGASELTPLNAQWGLFHPGVELGWRAEF